MVTDLLTQARGYEKLSEGIALALRIGAALTADTPCGRVSVDGDKLYYTVAVHEAAPREERSFEAHRRYADVHIVLEGRERWEYADVSALRLDREYRPDEDCALYAGDGALLSQPAGSFWIAFPQDAHRPALREGPQPGFVKKAVFKILLEGM